MVVMNKSPNDLQRVLGYVGAADERPGGSKLGDQMFVFPFWTQEFCDALIRAAEAVGGFDAHPDDPVPGTEISLAAISPKLFDSVQQDIGMRIWPQLRQHWPLIDYHGITDAFIIKYEVDGQEELRLHHDIAQVSASVKLNDGYTAAELEFPQQGVNNVSVAVGSLVAWPSLVTHPHRSNKITSGVKYSLTIWCELPLSLR